jgi:hypothetical protein
MNGKTYHQHSNIHLLLLKFQKLSITFKLSVFAYAKTCRKPPLQIHSVIWITKRFTAFLRHDSESVSFSTKCNLFHNFILFNSNNVFHNPRAKI